MSENKNLTNSLSRQAHLSASIREILKKYWGYSEFRPLQEDIILSLLTGHDTLALLPTGGGKSICFQVPALFLEGICIVVSPLIALMKDQVEQARARGIKAAAIYSGMSPREIDLTMNHVLLDKTCKLLYISPERLKTKLLKLNLPLMNVSFIAVDEAHCISQWGYDFRPPYLEIAQAREMLPGIPVMALTATATPEVVNDIQEKLKFRTKNCFQKSFARENLTYYVVEEENKMQRMLRVMRRYQGTGIVYVRNRKRTREVAEFLREHDIVADYYHAGLPVAERDKKQTAWIKGNTRVIVATNAFGMGIDKPDVRFVIHIDIPDSLEAYFQEAGRGGRDGMPSVAIMLYDKHDLRDLRENLENSYPPIATIREVYHHLANYYKIPLHGGANTSYQFDIDLFIKYAKMKPVLLFNALLLLEKGGYIALSEAARTVSMLQVLLPHADFAGLYQKHPEWENLMQMLLRSYGGLFHDYVKINEQEIARRLNTSPVNVVQHLQKMNKMKVLSYLPCNETPTLFFVENRIDERYLSLDPVIYRQRKKSATRRIEAVEHYVTSTQQCRSQILLSYFGEKDSLACEHCDVCVSIHRDFLRKQEFDRISTAIVEAFHAGSATPRDYVEVLSVQFEEEKILKVLRWMSDNGKIC